MRKQLPLQVILSFAVLLPAMIHAQIPVLKIADKEDKGVYLRDLSVDVKVVGTIATTTLQMTFFNSHNRILEGELIIPLPEGVSVSRYALDINGKMREAVPVEKAKATQVFESIERRNVDPGLIEKVDGNSFRTRIYPIPANGQRTILIGYEQELTMNDKNAIRYYLPMDYKTPIKHFKLNIAVLNSSGKPALEEEPDDLNFSEWNNNYTAAISKTNFKYTGAVSFSIPKISDSKEIIMQKNGANYYFLLNVFPTQKRRPKNIPGEIGVMWDVSLSGLHRDHKKELELLGAYIHFKKDLSIHFTQVGIVTSKSKEYIIRDGNWTSLKNDIESLHYDGATDYSKIEWPRAGEYLFFGDGLSSISSNSEIKLPAKPVYTISASPRSDYSALEYIAGKTGGVFINLLTYNTNEAKVILTEQQLQFIGIKNNDDVSETYPSISTIVKGSFSIAGISTEEEASITLQFGYGNTVIEEKIISLKANTEKESSVNIKRIWAQKKLKELDIQYENNKEEIAHLGKKYGIVTRNTSLIVLELVSDYIQYEIEPPAELREEYDRAMKDRVTARQRQLRFVASNTSSYFDKLVKWWETDFNPKAVTKKNAKNVVSSTTIGWQEAGLITGKVVDKEDRPLSGVSVSIKGTNTGTATLSDGTFSLRTGSRQPALVISAVGYSVVEINTANANNFTVSLNEVVRTLEEVVVVGYNSVARDSARGEEREVRRREVSSSVSTVRSNSLEQRLEGRVPGLTITQGTGTRSNFYEQRQVPDWTADPDGSKAIMTTKSWVPDRTYLKQIAAAASKDRYRKYLTLREKYVEQPVFYFEVANYFFLEKDTATAFRILSNIAETEAEDHEVYKMLGYKLQEINESELALYVFRKVMEWRPMEPQSYRDYGRVLEEAGYYQRALDTFYTALTKSFDDETNQRFEGIQEIIITEINQLITLHKSELNISRIDKKLIQAIPVDIRVVINWNKSATDIDLWVTDPDNEKCYYSHPQTTAGGRISDDQTSGYGPEQFMLRKAYKGKYTIQVNYYGDNQFKLSGPATVQAEIYMYYGTKKEQRKLVTLQMNASGENKVELIGDFTFE